MPTRATRNVTVRLILALSVVALAGPAAARAADPAAATITTCKADSLTVAGKVKLTGAAARKARGAVLQMRFQALGLFGFPQSGPWHIVGKKTKASGQETLGGLGADNWVGLLSWRFKKGSRTVLSGDERSQPLRIGGAKGMANCVISEGQKPIDTTPPQLFVLPVDDLWHKSPGQLQVTAQDDFSGVKSIVYSVDGGPITAVANGGIISVAAEGAHSVAVAATDVAGNTASRTVSLKVDAAPPTQPTLSKPSSVTASRTPTFQWSASSDSGSGLKGYALVILRGDGSVASFQTVDPNTTSATSAATLDDGQTYTAFVRAYDNTSPDPQTSDSPQLSFRVDTQPDMSASPADGSVLSGSAKSGNFTIVPDRPAVIASDTTIVLHNVDTGSDIPTDPPSCASPCTSITVHPKSTLPEGRYTLTVSKLQSDEGVVFPTYVAHYSVAFPNADGSSLSAQTSSPCLGSGTTSTSSAYPLSNVQSGEKGTLDFDLSATGSASWTVTALINTNPAGGSDTASGSGSAGHVHMGPFNLANGSLTFQLTVACSSTKVDLTNMVGARVP